MRASLFVLATLFTLAGCGGGGPSTEESAKQTGQIRLENATAAEVVKQAAAARDKNRIQSGEWENTVQLVSVDMPGAPVAMQKQMEAQTGKPPEAHRECKKAEDAKAVDFARLAPAAQGCTFPKYVAADGRIDARMECKGPFGPVTMTIAGSQSATAYDITVAQAQAMPGAAGRSTMTIRATGKRIGDCRS